MHRLVLMPSQVKFSHHSVGSLTIVTLLRKPEAPACQRSDSTTSNRCQGYLNFTQQLEQTSHVMAKKRDKAATEEGILA